MKVARVAVVALALSLAVLMSPEGVRVAAAQTTGDAPSGYGPVPSQVVTTSGGSDAGAPLSLWAYFPALVSYSVRGHAAWSAPLLQLAFPAVHAMREQPAERRGSFVLDRRAARAGR